MLEGDPVIGRERFDPPLAVEAADAGVLPAAERAERQIVHRLIVDMGHARLHPLREAHAAFEVLREDAAGEAILRVIGDPEGLLLVAGPNSSSRASGISFVTSSHLSIVG